MLSLRRNTLTRLEQEVTVARPDRWWTAIRVSERVALAALAVIVVVALVGPLLLPSAIVPAGGTLLPPFSPGHLLGTDALGMDLLSRLVNGMRSSLTAAALGQSITSAMIGICVVWWPLYARLVRGETRRIVVLPHVQAARVSGVRGLRLLGRHVAPAVSPTIAVRASLDIGGVIMVLASLSFIGLGTPAPAPELGRMASDGMRYLLTSWWIAVLPGLAIALLAFVFNYAGDALRVLLRRTGV
jgi:peptide/nickel transport system permease protein